jgi:hypothetical protein
MYAYSGTTESLVTLLISLYQTYVTANAAIVESYRTLSVTAINTFQAVYTSVFSYLPSTDGNYTTISQAYTNSQSNIDTINASIDYAQISDYKTTYEGHTTNLLKGVLNEFVSTYRTAQKYMKPTDLTVTLPSITPSTTLSAAYTTLQGYQTASTPPGISARGPTYTDQTFASLLASAQSSLTSQLTSVYGTTYTTWVGRNISTTGLVTTVSTRSDALSQWPTLLGKIKDRVTSRIPDVTTLRSWVTDPQGTAKTVQNIETVSLGTTIS